jgi:uncharacterized protein with PQ loop repeat
MQTNESVAPADKKPKKHPIDLAADLVGYVSPALGLPQAVQIYATQDATGLSLFSWASFAAVSAVFLIYGIRHKIKPLIVANGLWMAIYAAVIPGILIYG